MTRRLGTKLEMDGRVRPRFYRVVGRGGGGEPGNLAFPEDRPA